MSLLPRTTLHSDSEQYQLYYSLGVAKKVANTVWSSRRADEPIAHRASTNYRAFWVNFHEIARLIKLN